MVMNAQRPEYAVLSIFGALGKKLPIFSRRAIFPVSWSWPLSAGIDHRQKPDLQYGSRRASGVASHLAQDLLRATALRYTLLNG
jgi:hypothetical protein